MSKQLVEAIADMREQEALKMVREMVDRGSDPLAILDSTREAMDLVGRRFEEGTYFLPELMLAGEMMSQITEIIKPKLAEIPDIKRHGKVLIGTVAGDIHDIGKNIVSFMLDVNGFEVLDLGVDVSPQKFVEAIQKFQPQVVALSGFLTLSFDSMKNTVTAIQSSGLRERVKIMVGGGQINEEVKEYSGADGYGKDAVAGISMAKKWAGVK
ncbi:MAG TPA: cobalamin-dependent protein [Anaerolineales bacterium]|nr:cobalamin-dependent protein [Anaerolineales bacterium]